MKRRDKSSYQIRLEILRQDSPQSRPYRQVVIYTPNDDSETIARALNEINKSGYKDTDGADVEFIDWDCSCLQKKCGACAMVIDGEPRLACDAYLHEFRKKQSVTVSPLRKFPVIKDLRVDRSIMMDNLKTIQAWGNGVLSAEKKAEDIAYDASLCLQCGCCLEVCPNFCPGEDFCGTASFVPTMRLLTSLEGKELDELRESYLKHAYAGCGKSLACSKVCPADLDIENMLIRTNAAAVWKRKWSKK